MYKYGKYEANAVHEIFSGAIPGVISSSCRQDMCADLVRQKLQQALNISGGSSLPADLMKD
jgi:hypothetical protein